MPCGHCDAVNSRSTCHRCAPRNTLSSLLTQRFRLAPNLCDAIRTALQIRRSRGYHECVVGGRRRTHLDVEQYKGRKSPPFQTQEHAPGARRELNPQVIDSVTTHGMPYRPPRYVSSPSFAACSSLRVTPRQHRYSDSCRLRYAVCDVRTSCPTDFAALWKAYASHRLETRQTRARMERLFVTVPSQGDSRNGRYVRGSHCHARGAADALDAFVLRYIFQPAVDDPQKISSEQYQHATLYDVGPCSSCFLAPVTSFDCTRWVCDVQQFRQLLRWPVGHA